MLSKLTSSLELYVAALTPPRFALPDWHWPDLGAADGRIVVALGCFALLLVLEAPRARRERRARLYRQSYLANFGVLLVNDTLLSLLSVSSLWLVAERYAHWGVLSALPDSVWKSLLVFLLLDLTLYLWHRLNHNCDALWVLHKVHHSDRTMNVSTAFRLHIGEVLLTLLVKALFIVVVGVDAAAVVASEAVITLFVMFHHANLEIPGERWLARVLIVPALHRVHHSVRREEHDHNYGAVLSLWDRWFGTLVETLPKEIGLNRVEGMNLWQLLAYGFSGRNTPPPQKSGAATLLDLVRQGLSPRPLGGARQKGFPKTGDWVVEGQKLIEWMRFGGPRPENLQARIAEAAYYRAEKRGFVPGYECLDWLEAEREIMDKSHR